VCNEGQERPLMAKISKPLDFITSCCKINNKWECNYKKK
jgi:hypothetical protein